MDNNSSFPLTHLEKEILLEVVQPSITIPKHQSFAEILNFSMFLRKTKEFYENNGGKHWNIIINDL